jgi:hypothetical protein
MREAVGHLLQPQQRRDVFDAGNEFLSSLGILRINGKVKLTPW